MAVLGGFVYFIGPEDGPIKIGSSGDPARRVKTLQSGSPVPLALLGSFKSKDCVAEEKALHRRFAGSRLHGEWFSRTPALLKLVDSCRTDTRHLDVTILDPERAARVLSLVEASRVLGCSVDAVRKRAQRSTIRPAGRRGNALLYRLGDLV